MSSFSSVYINGLGVYLPNAPVESSDIEQYLGDVAVSKRLKDKIIRANGIRQRYYALDDTGNPTHLSEEMAELACIEALDRTEYSLRDVELLSFGTTHSDLLVPSITHMLLGRLGKRGLGPTSILPTSGVCLSSIFALKNAEMAIKCGEKSVALVGGVERPSVTMRACHYKDESYIKNTLREEHPDYSFFHTAFLRWMLSDGSAAAVLSNKPSREGTSLKIDWIEITSYANEAPTCMYAGTNVREGFMPTDTWWAQGSMHEASEKGMIVIRQDPTLLNRYIAPLGIKEALRLIRIGKLIPEEIDWFLPHFSSFVFQREMLDAMKESDINIDEKKWFTNLATKGNSGSAAIYIMLEEAVRTGLIQKGQKVLLMVPESARFSYGFVQLSCV